MGGRRYALVAALALFVIFIASNLIANSWFRSWRLDLTANHLYSLSPGTREVLNNLTEPVELTLYYSRDIAARVPQVQAYGARVREMLQSFQANSHGRIRFVEVNVKRFSEEEDRAGENGVEPQQVFQGGGDPLYFGLVGANAIDDRSAIPTLNPAREPFLEYEITRLITGLENPEPTHVALISALPVDPLTPGGQGGSQWTALREMSRLMRVQKLPADFTEIPADTDVLAIVHPPTLSPAQSYAIDQFIMRRGRAFIAIDPASFEAQRADSPLAAYGLGGGAPASSNLEPLLSRWGVVLSPDVVLDFDNAIAINAQNASGQTVPVNQPLFFTVEATETGGTGLDANDMMTAPLTRGLNFGMAGSLAVSERQGIRVTPIVRTSGHTARIEAQRALMRPSPFELMQMPPQEGRMENLAVRISGVLPSAYPEGPPADAVAPTTLEPAVERPPHLQRSEAPAEVVVVADVDFLSDIFYIDPNANVAVMDNGAFVLNAIDILSGSNALVSLRARSRSERKMRLIERMEAEAQRRIETRRQDLQAELQETEQRLQQLQAGGQGSGFFSGNLNAQMTEEEGQEVDRFRARVAEVRTELRSTERDLRRDINNLEALLMFINVWLAPLLVAAAGLFLFWRRQRSGARR